MRCTQSAWVLVAGVISPGGVHDAAAVVVPQMGCRAGEAAPDRTSAVQMSAPRPPKSTGGICCGSGCWGQAGTRAAGKTGRHLVHLWCCKRAKSRKHWQKRNTAVEPMADGGVQVDVAATGARKGKSPLDTVAGLE
jgi:hypothetical protein